MSAIPAQVLAQIAPTGRVRLAANMANASIVREVEPGRFAGPASDLAERLAGVLGLTVEIVPFASGGAILTDTEDWDLAVLAVDRSRAQVLYAHEITQVRATLAAHADDPASTCREADRPGASIATARGAAYERHLQEHLAHAEIVSFETPAAARDAMLTGVCDFVAGIRATLHDSLSHHPGIRLMQDDFLTVAQALAVPAEHKEAAAFLSKILGCR